MNDYYVYCYIDPRNYNIFYYGKGQGSRKFAHLSDKKSSIKTKVIKAIEKEGLKPIIRIIAKGLTEEQALLVEKTLIWKDCKYLSNISSGAFADHFRPQDSLHKNLNNFDFQSDIYYYNTGERRGGTRDWDDYRKFGFISGGQGTIFRDAMLKFNVGDVFAARITGRGFVGIGRILDDAKMASKVSIKGKALLDHDLKCKGLSKNSDNPEKSEYVCKVEWLRAVPREEAFWKRNSKLYAKQQVRASLSNQKETIDFLNNCFDIDLFSEIN